MKTGGSGQDTESSKQAKEERVYLGQFNSGIACRSGEVSADRKMR